MAVAKKPDFEARLRVRDEDGAPFRARNRPPVEENGKHTIVCYLS